LAKRNATIYVACRDKVKGLATVEELKNVTKNQNIFFEELDLGSLASVKRFAKKFNDGNIPINVLINNAGVMNCPKGKTIDGFETQIGVNHFGQFYLTNLLLPNLQKGAPSRVVCVSSDLHKRGSISFDDINWEKRKYSGWQAYSQSKLANVLFTKELNNRFKTLGITAYSLHPGVIPTDLLRHSPILQGVIGSFGRLFMKSIPQGAATSVYCAIAPGLESLGGQYFVDCNVTEPSNMQLNQDTATKLWTASEKAVGLGK